MAASKRTVSLNSKRKKTAIPLIVEQVSVENDFVLTNVILPGETTLCDLMQPPESGDSCVATNVNVDHENVQSQLDFKQETVSVGSKRRSRRSSMSSTPSSVLIPFEVSSEAPSTEACTVDVGETNMISDFFSDLVREEKCESIPTESVPPARKRSRRASVSGAVNAAMLRDSVQQNELMDGNDVLFNGMNVKSMSRVMLREALKSLAVPCPAIKEDMVQALADFLLEKQSREIVPVSNTPVAAASDQICNNECTGLSSVEGIQVSASDLPRSGRAKRTAASKMAKFASVNKARVYEAPVVKLIEYVPFVCFIQEK
jgi:hypothetical protein